MNSKKILREYIRIILEARNIPEFTSQSRLAQKLNNIVNSILKNPDLSKMSDQDLIVVIIKEGLKKELLENGFKQIGIDHTAMSYEKLNDFLFQAKNVETFEQNLASLKDELNDAESKLAKLDPKSSQEDIQSLNKKIEIIKRKINEREPKIRTAKSKEIAWKKSGSTRLVFIGKDKGQPHVIKIALSIDGLKQNAAEVNAYENLELTPEEQDLVTKTWPGSKFLGGYMWIAAEKAVPLKDKGQFEELMGFPHNVFTFFVCRDEKEIEEKMNSIKENDREKYIKLEAFQKKVEPWRGLVQKLKHCADATKLESLGIVKDDDGSNKLVTFDYGLTRVDAK